MNISEFSQRPTAGSVYAKNEVPPFVITTASTLLAILEFGNEEVFRGSYVPDFSGQISIDFKGIYDEYLKTNIPTTGANEITHTEYIGQFTATFYVLEGEDVSGDPATLSWYVANAKLKSNLSFMAWSATNFLTNQPIEKVTNFEAPEWLTWYRPEAGVKLKVRFYRKDGTSLDATVFDSLAAGAISVNVRYSRLIAMAGVMPISLFGYYDLILFDVKNTELARQRYIYEERCGKEKYYLFVNALGGIDTLICDGENVLQPEVEHNVGRFSNQYRALDDTDDNRQWSQSTGSVPSRQRNWIYELLTAKQGAEKYEPETMEYYEIVVNSSEISMSDFGQLSEATFGYILNETENVVADTERPDRSFHESTAESAEELHDLSSTVTASMKSDGQGGYNTDELEIPATKLYVTDPRSSIETGEEAVYYYLNESGTAAGSFTPGVTEMPVVITKLLTDTIHFSTQNEAIGSLVINYYPTNIQAI